MRLVSHRIAHIALLSLLASSSFLGFSRVLCVGADGHAEIELVQDGSCHTDSCTPGSGLEASVGLFSADGCGPCTDFLLDQALSLDLWRASFQLLPPVASGFSFRLPFDLWTAPLFAQPPPRLASALLALRSVRLLI